MTRKELEDIIRQVVLDMYRDDVQESDVANTTQNNSGYDAPLTKPIVRRLSQTVKDDDEY